MKVIGITGGVGSGKSADLPGWNRSMERVSVRWTKLQSSFRKKEQNVSKRS